MTRAHEVKPLRRVVRDQKALEYVAEIRADSLTLRPLRCRRGGPADVSIGWGAVYVRACMAKQIVKRRKVSRGLLS